MKFKNKNIIFLLTFLLLMCSFGSNISADDGDDILDEGLVSIIDNDQATEEDIEAYNEAYQEIQQEIKDEIDLSQFEDVLTEEEKSEQETMMFSRAAFSSPRIGYFTDSGYGSNANIYLTSTTSTAYTYISAGQYYTGMFPILEEANGRYRVVVAGIDGWINKSGVTVDTYDSSKAVNVYVNTGSKFTHIVYDNTLSSTKNNSRLYAVNQMSTIPSYINTNTNYYSFDGHYFYTNFTTLYNDYVKGVRTNAINANNPYYNYFQFLPYRSSASTTAAQFNSYFTSNKPNLSSSTSKMYGNGQSFVTSSQYYGTNPLITYSMAILESGWGTSGYALNRNNLFGHSAYDSDPDQATYYSSVESNINYHHGYFANWLYLDATGRIYQGGSVGDKSTGMNVKYSSDPYWGEKIASIMSAIDTSAGGKEVNKYQLGVTTDDVTLRNGSSTSNSKIFILKKGYPVIIYDKVAGQTVNGSNNTWYKTSSDSLLNSSGTILEMPTPDPAMALKVDLNKTIGYIYSDYVKIVNGTNTPITYPKGDVNGDGKVSSLDYIAIKNHILKTRLLSGDALKRADVNGDGKVSSLDYIAIKNHILGIKRLD